MQDTTTYYAKNKNDVLKKQRMKRSTPEQKAKTREYSRLYYQQNRDEIIQRITERKNRVNFDFEIKKGSYTINFN